MGCGLTAAVDRAGSRVRGRGLQEDELGRRGPDRRGQRLRVVDDGADGGAVAATADGDRPQLWVGGDRGAAMSDDSAVPFQYWTV